MNNSSKTNTVLLVILIVIALGIVFLQVSRKMLFSQRQNIPKETMNSEYVPGTHQEVDQNNNTQNWKTFESKYIPLSFKYKESWGEPIERYFNTQDKTCDPNLGWCAPATGKDYSLIFSKQKLSPSLCLLSLDYSRWEGGATCYKGDMSLDEYYKPFIQFSDNVTQLEASMIDTHEARKFSYYNVGLGGGVFEKRVYTQINTPDFKGFDISLPFMFFGDEDPPSFDKALVFFKKYKTLGEAALDQETKNNQKDFETFVASIKINDR